MLKKICISLVVIAGIWIGLRSFNLIRPFKNPGLGMVPSLNAGDYLIMEGVSYIFNKPKRGDIIVFKTEGIPAASGEYYLKRIVGEPGETLRIRNETISINNNDIHINNAKGKIKYCSLPGKAESEEFYIPNDSFFVLGDNSLNSFDSRMIGFVPKKNVIGKIIIRYAPLNNIGFIK